MNARFARCSRGRLTPALRSGDDTIVIVGQNGPYDCSPPCPYSQNPAGVVFEGTIRW